MTENAETVNAQEKEPQQDTVASAAEPQEECLEAVEADEIVETEAEPLDPEAALKEALAQAEAQANEYLDGWQRARAEFANYRRREQVRREQAETDIAARVLGHFLPVLDDLERAFSSVPPEVQGNSWVDGLAMVAQKMLAGMEKESVAVMRVEPGDEFDPNVHMAVLHTPCADYDAGQVAMVLQRGYTIGERVLRPAMVQVSSGAPPAEASAGEGADDASDTGKTSVADEPAEESIE